jgi:hypothetical protein
MPSVRVRLTWLIWQICPNSCFSLSHQQAQPAKSRTMGGCYCYRRPRPRGHSPDAIEIQAHQSPERCDGVGPVLGPRPEASQAKPYLHPSAVFSARCWDEPPRLNLRCPLSHSPAAPAQPHGSSQEASSSPSALKPSLTCVSPWFLLLSTCPSLLLQT